LDQVFNRFRSTIEAKIRESAAVPELPKPTKVSPTARIVDALSNWKWFEDAWNQTVNELKNAPDATPLFFQNLKDALDVPFTGSELAKGTREQGGKIEGLLRKEQNRMG